MAQLKLFDPFSRGHGIILERFSQHWTAVHAEIARDIPQIRHYVQSHRLSAAPPALEAPLGTAWCDGVSETWYDDVDSFRQMLAEPGIRTLLRDESNFMDLQDPRSPLLTHEHLVDAGRFDPALHGVKVLLFVRRRPELGVEDFRQQWLVHDGAELGRSIGATRHVACVAVDEDITFEHPDSDVFEESRQRPFDGVRELWFPDRDALRDGAERSPKAWSTLFHPQAADLPASFAFCAIERVIRP
jgi:uncharacterized protein (TIGR02118 family)